jgi:hypothetical protein
MLGARTETGAATLAATRHDALPQLALLSLPSALLFCFASSQDPVQIHPGLFHHHGGSSVGGGSVGTAAATATVLLALGDAGFTACSAATTNAPDGDAGCVSCNRVCPVTLLPGGLPCALAHPPLHSLCLGASACACCA